jgi:hypothetical protein
VIIILVVIVALTWLKQKVTCHHLKYSTRQRPDVSRCIVIGTYNDLRGPILTSLNFRSKVMISPATVTHVAYLYHHVFINLGTSLTFSCLQLRCLIWSSSTGAFVVLIEEIPDLLLSACIDAGLLRLLLFL